MTPITPDLLECLAAIVEEGGFEKAAKRLSITQSAVSQRLRTLETQTGTVLIVRGRPLKPTPAGRLLHKVSQLTDSQLTKMLNAPDTSIIDGEYTMQ